MVTTRPIPLGVSTFVLASPFSDADLGLFGKVKSFGYEQFEVCIEDPGRLTASAVAKARTPGSGPSARVARRTFSAPPRCGTSRCARASTCGVDR